MYDYISTHQEWVLEVGRREGVINNDSDFLAELSDNLNDGFNIDEFHGWVGWGFNPDELGVLFKFALECLDISHIDEVNFNLVFFYGVVLEVVGGSSVDIVHRNDMVTNAEGVQDRGHGRTTAGAGNAELAVF